jgi:hypothetical protein
MLKRAEKPEVFEARGKNGSLIIDLIIIKL